MLDEKFLIRKDLSIRETLKKLDETAEKALFLVNSGNILIGAISDGDIRRHILKGHGLNGSIAGIYNRTPISVRDNEFSIERVKNIFLKNKIAIVPVVDARGKIVDI